MPPVVAVLFWVWVLVSVAYLVHRRITRRRAGEEGVEDDIDATEAFEAPVADPAPAPVPVTAAVGAPVAAGPIAAAPVAAAPAPPSPPPGYEPVPAASVERHRSAPAAGIADALVGIRMPCDLVPLVVDRLANNHITLSTTGYPAEVVGTALADEVERLGYVLRPMSDRELVATRGTTELRLTIDPPGVDGRHLEHPNARDQSVVVRINLS